MDEVKINFCDYTKMKKDRKNFNRRKRLSIDFTIPLRKNVDKIFTNFQI